MRKPPKNRRNCESDAGWQEMERCIFVVDHPRIKSQSGNPSENTGEAGIRTLGTLLGYNALAKLRLPRGSGFDLKLS